VGSFGIVVSHPVSGGTAWKRFRGEAPQPALDDPVLDERVTKHDRARHQR
jgi:hypothetical protein